MWIVTETRLERALRTAVADFAACGLYTRALHRAPVYWYPAGQAYGWCRSSGEIVIPAVSLERLKEKSSDDFERVSLADILRHELAHSLAHLHPRSVDTVKFRRVFGGSYWDATAFEYDPEQHVSPYAATSPSEDFAETVMVYTRHRGRTSRFSHRHGVMAGFQFVRGLASSLRRHQLG